MKKYYLTSLLVPMLLNSAELIVNGSFETGDFTGWTTGQSPAAYWQINGGPVDPSDGSNYAFVDQSNPSNGYLYQDVSIPSGKNIKLSFDLWYDNYANQGFVIPNPDTLDYDGGSNQQFRVDIMDPSEDPYSLNVSRNLISTPPGTASSLDGFQPYEFDISEFGGQDIRLRYAFADNLLPLLMGIDHVSIIDYIPRALIFNFAQSILLEQTQLNLDQNHRFARLRQRFSQNGQETIANFSKSSLEDSSLTASAGDVVQAGSFRHKDKTKPGSIYIAPFGNFGKIDTINAQMGNEYTSLGGLLGGDYAFSRMGLGAQVGYVKFHGSAYDYGNYDQNEVFLGVYGTFLPTTSNYFYLDLSLFGGYDWYESNRITHLGYANSKPDGWNIDGFAEIGYDYNFGKMRLTPQLALQYAYINISDYQETNALVANLSVDQRSMNSLRSWLGLSYGGEITKGSFKIMPEIRAFWLYEYLDLDLDVDAITFDNQKTHISIYGHERNSGVLGAELNLESQNWTITFDYDFFFNNGMYSNMLYGEIGYNF